eukprot:31143-Pelagococcus_subviridis.AAC.3
MRSRGARARETSLEPRGGGGGGGGGWRGARWWGRRERRREEFIDGAGIFSSRRESARAPRRDRSGSERRGRC